MPKIKKKSWMPNYNPTKEQNEAYLYCLRRNIKISPGGILGVPNRWTVDIFAKGKWNKSPESYGPKEIWEVFYNYCLYYKNK